MLSNKIPNPCHIFAWFRLLNELLPPLIPLHMRSHCIGFFRVPYILLVRRYLLFHMISFAIASIFDALSTYKRPSYDFPLFRKPVRTTRTTYATQKRVYQ